MAKVRCPKCGTEFYHAENDRIVALNKSGYDILKTDDHLAEDLFEQVLKTDPKSFEASIGMAFCHLTRIERAQNDLQTAVGVYYLTRPNADAQWALTVKDHAEAERYIEHLNNALKFAPQEMKHKIKLYRRYYVEDAWKIVQKMIGEK